MAISKKAFLGVARETTSGTPVATPTLYLPAKTTFKNQTKYVYLEEERGTRDGNYGRVATNQQGSLTTKGPWYNDASPYFLMGWMGADTPTQPNATTAPTVWSHALSCADIPPSLTLFRSVDYATYQFAYSVVSKVKLSFSGNHKLLEMDNTIESAYGTKMGTPPTSSFSSVLPFAGYIANIQLGGVQSIDIEQMDIELDQKVTLFFGADGTPGFSTIYFGERTAKLSFDARFDNDTLYNKFHDSPNIDDHISVVFTGATISSTYKQSLTLDFPIVGYDEMDHDTSKDNVMLKVKATARPGSTPNSLMTATVQNTIASYLS